MSRDILKNIFHTNSHQRQLWEGELSSNHLPLVQAKWTTSFVKEILVTLPGIRYLRITNNGT